MRLSVSNIAWPAPLRSEALDVLAKAGITGIEVAPTMEWPDWQIHPGQAGAFRQALAARDFTISSLQSILFSKPGAQLFGDAAAQMELRQHLEFCAELAAELGAGPLVFGAPKNRLRGALTEEEAREVAVEVFRNVAPAFSRTGTCLCLEANPSEYGCDFLTRAGQAAAVVRAVGRSGIGLHLDTACMHLAGDQVARLIEDNADILTHFHVSEPFLGGMEAPVVDHAAAASALRQTGYGGWVVLEMRASDQPLNSLRKAVDFLTAVYGDEAARL